MKRQLGPPTAEERGHLFEGWVASVLRAYRDYRGLFEDWGYWASGHGSSLEVDFILRRGKDLIALEVRSGRKVFDADLRGLRAIADLPQVVRRLVVCRGDRRQKTADGIDILPVASSWPTWRASRSFPRRTRTVSERMTDEIEMDILLDRPIRIDGRGHSLRGLVLPDRLVDLLPMASTYAQA